MFDALDIKGRQAAEKSGNEIIEIKEPMKDPAWGPLLQSMVDDYLDLVRTPAFAL